MSEKLEIGDISWRVFYDEEDKPWLGRMECVHLTAKLRQPHWRSIDTKEKHLLKGARWAFKGKLAAIASAAHQEEAAWLWGKDKRPVRVSLRNYALLHEMYEEASKENETGI